jgi:hypothetical protein
MIRKAYSQVITAAVDLERPDPSENACRNEIVLTLSSPTSTSSSTSVALLRLTAGFQIGRG